MRRSRRPRIGLFGILGSGNLGNDGSLEAMVSYLRRDHPDATLGFMCMGVETITARYGGEVTGLQWYEQHAEGTTGLTGAACKILGRMLDPVRTLLWARKFDVVIVPGMGVLETTTPVRPWSFPYSLFWLGVVAKITRTRVALVSVGANVVKQPATRFFVTSASKLADHRSFRDDLSRDSMKQMGVDTSHDHVCPDLAFALPVAVVDPQVQPSGVVAVGLMAYVGTNDDRKRAEQLHINYLDAMQKFVIWLLDEGHDVLLFSGDQEDEPVVRSVLQHAETARPELAGPRVRTSEAETLPQLLSDLSQVDAVVASRYHNVLSALSLSRPTISVSYARKHDDLMASMGQERFCHPARTVDHKALAVSFEELQRERVDIVTSLQESNRQQRENLEGLFRLLSETTLRFGPS